MSEEMDFDYTPDIYTLVDEEGNEQQFELLDVMELDDNRYFALLPYYEDADEALNSDGDLVVLKAEMVDGEEMMASIDDDEEYDRVGNLFLEKLASMYEEEMDEIEGNLQ
jgi:uncharacterized protein YrzB (UPF0473 family)